ncbi:uclacyanin 1-like [Phragmites australis]|uniref:uclacyanin 1-like n=1 Tax=Phragmites australis TaxID=29695 RepID=UPI002D79283D|nr:uclacyanin 1-like [Phragmites australis]
MARLGTILLTLLAGFLLSASRALAADHVVGGSVWSIPPSADLYSAWAANRTFLVGDNLVYRFEIGFYDVVQVSRREYEDCTTDDPFRTSRADPAVVPLDAVGVRYFVCSVGNYCSLGVKLYVTVQNPH